PGWRRRGRYGRAAIPGERRAMTADWYRRPKPARRPVSGRGRGRRSSPGAGSEGDGPRAGCDGEGEPPGREAVARRHDDDVISRLRKSRGESRIATAARIVVLGGCGLESGSEEKEVRVERIGREVDRHGLAGVAREPPLLCVGILGTEQDVAAGEGVAHRVAQGRGPGRR